MIFKLCLLMILIFISLVIFLWKKKREKISRKITIQVKCIWSISLKVLLIGLILFLYLKIIFIIQEVRIDLLDTLIIAICGVLTTLLGAEISKNIILFIKTISFSRKYGGTELTNKEILNISNNNESSFILWNYILTFIIYGLIYSMINDFIFNENRIIETILISLISTTCYWFVFEKNILDRK